MQHLILYFWNHFEVLYNTLLFGFFEPSRIVLKFCNVRLEFLVLI